MEIAIGTNKITGQDVVIDDARHIYVEGMSGVGKSTALVNLFIRCPVRRARLAPR
jgi:DNA segregation ATPase FtsK/SpoIIIE-like protein